MYKYIDQNYYHYRNINNFCTKIGLFEKHKFGGYSVVTYLNDTNEILHRRCMIGHFLYYIYPNLKQNIFNINKFFKWLKI